MKADDDFAFGDGGFCKLYGDRLADSSLLDCAVATRSLGRFRCATVAGLARAAAVSPAEAETAICELEAPDPDSSSPEEDGRRILRIAGGWQIVTYAKYRDYQTKRQRAEAERKRRQRAAAQEEGGTSPEESGTCPGTSQGHTHETPNAKRQRTEQQTTPSSASPPTEPPTGGGGRDHANDSPKRPTYGSATAVVESIQKLADEEALRSFCGDPAVAADLAVAIQDFYFALDLAWKRGHAVNGVYRGIRVGREGLLGAAGEPRELTS